ncbi:lamin tail domain-containing protein [Streptomyces sp. B21-097]|nr:lamin tail domain-containing protein [Streptomyces scabiei]
MSASASATSSARRFAAAALVTGALVSAAAPPASAADHGRSRHPRVQISAVMNDSAGRGGRSNRSLNKERVQLVNLTRHAVNLDGWTLANENGRTYTFHHYRLAARTTVRIHTGKGLDTRDDLYQNRRDYVWDNDADTVILRDDRGRLVDDSSWGHSRRRR